MDSGRSEGNICPRSHYLHQISSTNTTTNTTTNTNGNINTNKVSALNSKHLFLILSFKAKTLDNGESCLILLPNLIVQKYMKRPLLLNNHVKRIVMTHEKIDQFLDGPVFLNSKGSAKISWIVYFIFKFHSRWQNF